MFPRAWAGATLCALLLGSGLGAHRWAQAHVAHYTGDAPRSTGCGSCHFAASGGTVMDRLTHPRYLSPLDIAVGGDGSRLYVTAQDADALLEVDAAGRRLVRNIPVGRRPNSVVLDERRAREIAQRLGLRFIGLLGVLIEAQRKHRLPRVRPVLDDLRQKAGFWMTDTLYQRVLAAAGE